MLFGQESWWPRPYLALRYPSTPSACSRPMAWALAPSLQDPIVDNYHMGRPTGSLIVWAHAKRCLPKSLMQRQRIYTGHPSTVDQGEEAAHGPCIAESLDLPFMQRLAESDTAGLKRLQNHLSRLLQGLHKVSSFIRHAWMSLLL